MTRTATPRQTAHRLHRLPADRRRRRVARRQRVRRHQRDLHRQGRLGRPGSVADRRPARSRSARSTRRSSSSSTSPARRRRPTPTAAAGRAPQQPRQRRLAAAQRSVQPVPDRHVAFRYADGAAGRTAGSPLAAIDIRQDSITGPIIADGEPDVDGRHRPRGRRPDVPARRRAAGKHELFVTFRTVTGGATGANLFNLNWAEFGGNGVTVSRDQHAGRRGRHGAGHAGAVARHAGGVRAVHPGRGARRTPRRRRPTSSRPRVTRR